MKKHEETEATRSCPTAEGDPQYELELALSDFEGYFVMTVNGFPVERLPGMSSMTEEEVTGQLNTALVGEGNEAVMEVMPFMVRSGRELNIGTIEMSAEMLCEEMPIAGIEITEVQVDSAYQDWTEQAREQWAEYRSAVERDALDSMRAWAERHPLTVSTTFDNEAGPDFSRIFEEAPVLEDTPATRKRLTNYAIRLRDLMAEKDTSGLVREFRPKMRYSYQIGAHDARSFQEYVSTYRKHYVLEGAEEELNFSREEVRLRKWSGGRVWQLRRAGAEGLLRRMRVYVAELEGELKVVR